jgi:hypothetical protein
MTFVGTWTAMASLQSGIERGFEEAARRFAIVPISGIIFFAVVVGIAIANVRRPDTHMRLMLLASVSILQAAVGRIVLVMLAPDVPRPGVGPPPPVEHNLWRRRHRRSAAGRRHNFRLAHARESASCVLDRRRRASGDAVLARRAQPDAGLAGLPDWLLCLVA